MNGPRGLARLLQMRGRFSFLKGNLRFILLWPAVALTVCLIGWLLVYQRLHEEHTLAERNALWQATSQATLYASQVTRTLESIDQIALFVKQGWELSHGMLHLEDLNERGLLPPSDIFYVAIFNAAGKLLTATVPEVAQGSAEDAPFFTAQKNLTRDSLFISDAAYDPATRRQVIQFSRRLEDTNGQFAGVVLVAVVPGHFTEAFDESSLGPNGFIGIARTNGKVLTARTRDRESANLPIANLPRLPLPRGSMLLPLRSDGMARGSLYLGWHHVEGYPVVALAGIDAQAALLPYMEDRATSLRNASLGSVALIAFSLIAMVLSIRLVWRKHLLALTQTTYRIATEGGSDGFYIARPIRDAEGKIVDFTVVDCNERGAEMLRRRRQDLIGKTVVQLYGSADPTRLLAHMRQAMETGFLEYETQVQADSPAAPRWVHLRMVRPDGDLAITLRDITEAKAHVAELERIGNEDALTGLPNRHWLNAYLPKVLQRAQVADKMLALLFIDLDGFKAINDTMGHEAGDELLQNAGRRLKLAVRPQDHVVRIGGDEFVVVLEDLPHTDDAAHVAARILQAFKEVFHLPQGMHSVGTSIGISVYPNDGTDASTLVKHADIAMYSVKTRGKRSFAFFDQRFYEALRDRHEREEELRNAIEHDQFVMYYQPRADVQTGVTCSMEALVRWQHPVHGLIEPTEFIPLAEETGLIVPLGALIVDKVCRQIAEWQLRGGPLVPVSINVSPRQFNEANVAATFADCIQRYGVDPSLVEIELTESSMMGNSENVGYTLNGLQAMGITLLVDDFGTGYSSLSQLQRLDFDVLKVDRAFTCQLGRSTEGSVFFKAIITMAHALGMRVVAEGVENLAQIEILQSLHCDELQGFYISKPVPPSETQPAVSPEAIHYPVASDHLRETEVLPSM